MLSYRVSLCQFKYLSLHFQVHEILSGRSARQQVTLNVTHGVEKLEGIGSDNLSEENGIDCRNESAVVVNRLGERLQR